jgi:hypothetical protein
MNNSSNLTDEEYARLLQEQFDREEYERRQQQQPEYIQNMPSQQPVVTEHVVQNIPQQPVVQPQTVVQPQLMQPQLQPQIQPQVQYPELNEQILPQVQPTTESQPCKSRCRFLKIGGIGLTAIVAVIVFLVIPAIQFFFKPYGFQFYFIPIALFVMVGGITAIRKHMHQDTRKKRLLIHTFIFAVINFTLYLYQLNMRFFPFNIYIFGIWSIILGIHALKVQFPDYYNRFSIHTIVYISCVIMIYLTYCFGYAKKRFFDSPFYLFFGVIIIWSAIYIVHYLVHSGRLNIRRQGSMQTEQPMQPTQSMQQSNDMNQQQPYFQPHYTNNTQTGQNNVYPQIL